MLKERRPAKGTRPLLGLVLAHLLGSTVVCQQIIAARFPVPRRTLLHLYHEHIACV